MYVVGLTRMICLVTLVVIGGGGGGGGVVLGVSELELEADLALSLSFSFGFTSTVTSTSPSAINAWCLEEFLKVSPSSFAIASTQVNPMLCLVPSYSSPIFPSPTITRWLLLALEA